MVNSLPLVALNASTEAFVIVQTSRPSKGRWPGLTWEAAHFVRDESAVRRFVEGDARKSPGLMSASEIGLANTISVFSLDQHPFLAVHGDGVTVNRRDRSGTRVCADAQLAAKRSARKTTLVRRLDAILAHVEAFDHDLVAFLARWSRSIRRA